MDTNEYPRMLYHGDGRTQTVADEHAEKAAGHGWSREPSEVHFAPRTPSVPGAVPPVDPSGQDAIIDRLIDRMRAEFFSDDAADEAADRPRRGRPRNADRAASRTSDSD